MLRQNWHLAIFLISLSAGFGCGGVERIKVKLMESPAVAVENPALQTTEPDSPRLSRAIELYESGEFVAARDTLDQMLWEAPRGWRVYYYLGLAHTECRQYLLADSRLEQSLDLAPNENLTRSRIYLALGQNSEVQGETPRATLLYQTALNLDPESIAASEALKRLKSVSQLTD